jgi:hypothetical protein
VKSCRRPAARMTKANSLSRTPPSATVLFGTAARPSRSRATNCWS